MNTLKSKLIKLIMTGLLVLTAFAFIACGGNQAPEDNSENNSEDDVETVSGTASIGKTQALAEAAIEALGDYEICSKYKTVDDDEVSETTWVVGTKGDTIWASLNGSGSAFKTVGDTVYCYTSSTEDGTTTYEYNNSLPATTDIQASLNAYKSSMATWFYFAYAYDGQLTKVGPETVAGRPCTHYTYSDTAVVPGAYATVKYDIYIDNATGLNLNVIWEAKTSTGNGSFGFEVTSFKTGNDVTAPTLKDPEPASDED